MTAEEGYNYVNMLRKSFNDFEKIPQITIASIDGFALGGGLEVALACDLRVGGNKSVYGLVETSIGIIPGAGGSQRLPRLIGAGKAKELIYTARKIDVQQAFEYGILNHKSNEDNSYQFCLKLAHEILCNAPIALRSAKKAINEGLNCSKIEEGMKLEEKYYKVAAVTEDRQEALRAFKEKRNPVYVGK